jgi:hypothetical protein
MFIEFLTNTNPTKFLCQGYQIHLHNLSNLEKNQSSHLFYAELPGGKKFKRRDQINMEIH